MMAATPDIIMNLIIKVILFPIIVLLLLLKGIGALFRSEHSSHIPKIVEKLASEREPFGTAIKELTFDQVMAYASKKGAILVLQPNYFEFEIDIDGKKYHTAISRAPDRSNCAIFRCRPAAIHVTPSVKAVPRSSSPSLKHPETTNTSMKEIEEIASVVNGLNTIFDKHTQRIKW